MNFNIHFLTINSKISSLLCPLSLQPLLLQACYHPLSTACHCQSSVDYYPSPTTHRLVLVACDRSPSPIARRPSSPIPHLAIVIHCLHLPPTICCQLPIVHHVLFVAYCPLFIGHCLPPAPLPFSHIVCNLLPILCSLYCPKRI